MSESDPKFTLGEDSPHEVVFVREHFDDIEPHASHDLAKGLLPAHGFGFLAGPSGTLKTFLALDWALRLARGLPILSHRTTPCGVIYIASEAPNGVRKRVQAWKQTYPDCSPPFQLIARAPDLRSLDDMQKLGAELAIASEEMAKDGHRLGLVVIDTLAASMPGGDENAGSDMSAVLANIGRLASDLGCFVLVIAHTGKDEARGLRGWSGQYAGADCVIMLTREEDTQLRLGKVAKLKEGEDGERFAIRLEIVELGVDDDGDRISSGVIVYEEVPEGATKSRKSSLNQPAILTLDAMGRLEDTDQLETLPPVPGARPGTKGARLNKLRQTAFDMGLKKAEEPTGDGEDAERRRWLDTRRKAFQRAIEDLVKARRLCQEGDWLWLP